MIRLAGENPMRRQETLAMQISHTIKEPLLYTSPLGTSTTSLCGGYAAAIGHLKIVCVHSRASRTEPK